MNSAKLDILIVGEEYREDGLDRASIVARGVEYALRGFLRADNNKSGRSNLTPERVAEIVRESGCLVVLVDAYDFASDGDATPKIRAALLSLAPDQPWCYVLPLFEQAAAEDEATGYPGSCKLVEDAAIMLVEHLAKKYGGGEEAKSASSPG